MIKERRGGDGPARLVHPGPRERGRGLGLIVFLQTGVGPLPVRAAELIDLDGLEMFGQAPQTGVVAQGETGAGLTGQLPDQDPELTPCQRPRAEKITEAYLVVLPQVRLNGLAVLAQEPDEASDSPGTIPQCF
ncbi:hypothetical protein [Streptomyces sp. CAU 1734]|uniref:hypothetical protein n=1 Tax=Streptomyces sp. CAU 1734 TaxID=3140360 RepID=UPI003260B74F